jgi:RNA polymerase sigma-70 factor (ECF subfamily)
MKLRKKKQSQTVSMEDLAPAVKQYCMERESVTNTHSYNITVTRELQEVLQRAIDKLPDQYRAVFILRDVDGLSNQETGEILDLSIPAVKSRLHRSRIMLRKRLQRYYEDFTGNKAVIEEVNDDAADQVAA